MIACRRRSDELDDTEVFRQWIRREARKDQYPDADPSDWERTRLIEALGETYEEPIRYATVRSPAWTSLVVSGSAVGNFDPYPSIGCNALTNQGRLAEAIDRLRTADRSTDFPDAVATVRRFRRMLPEHDLGAIVVRHFDECWPPVTLDGNHRAWAAILASRDGIDVELTVHFAHERPLEELPIET